LIFQRVVAIKVVGIQNAGMSDDGNSGTTNVPSIVTSYALVCVQVKNIEFTSFVWDCVKASLVH
jgi:hypothetical protein